MVMSSQYYETNINTHTLVFVPSVQQCSYILPILLYHQLGLTVLMYSMSIPFASVVKHSCRGQILNICVHKMYTNEEVAYIIYQNCEDQINSNVLI